MNQNQELYEFLLERTWELTEEWYESLDRSDTTGVYSSTNTDVINSLKQRNYEFHKQFCQVFVESGPHFFNELEEWVTKTARDEEHIKTPPHLILREFFRTQEQYLDLLSEFADLQKENYSFEKMNSLNRLVVQTFAKIITWFRKEQHTYIQQKLRAQQELIDELGSPVIRLNKDLALLPLVGDIDTERAQNLIENALNQCAEGQFSHLLIDLSGVVVVDTMVAQQIFQLIEALGLIGVTSTLSGIRPEIAQTAVQLGIDFSSVSVASTLEEAMKNPLHF
ncbi:STAS domain-containing protein [Siminovitchia acidinfaciens]|uniref:STAS domain-containing protein n=1 Tax=Siminovitchia acidinfaciens TaxID=2321395 RepID=A0A429Y1T3_9BACI|nr:STAS domain-containing protein [Siminovitchia acidinfaciens]RST75126.1 STAS domain-containing protein [Siminovitchia acidinfaciens]